MYKPSSSKPVTVPELRKFKQRGEKIAMLTAYDASFAAALDAQGVDAVLVGDSLGMVIQGRDSTLSVTLDELVYHCAAAARGLRRALLIADMPFLSFADPSRAVDAARRLLGEGHARMVKLEGAGYVVEIIRHLVERDVPVCAHLGLTPQSVHRLGGYKVPGRDAEAAERLLADAQAVAAAGAELLVLECVPARLAERIGAALDIATIGIGAGPHCDGQVLVLHDMLGVTPGRRPKFSRDFLSGHDSIAAAVAEYVAAVKEGRFPAPEHVLA
jgi:3-methyl-2-oxobutanoate hydroxymethyltransferase